jgi:uncharacterized SAM-binding protein YcdF (DUF218 family)
MGSDDNQNNHSNNLNNLSIDECAKIIWDYHHVNHQLEKSDCLFVLCSHDLRVADYATKLFFDGYAPLIIFSGGMAHEGDLLETGWKNSEAEIFAERAINLGIPRNKIIIENKAKNCGENVLFTDKILIDENLHFNSFIAVQKPYMERRTYATIKVHWPNKKLIVASPPINFNDYPTNEISKDDVINIMVGDLQRIKIYPEMGFQIYQEIPSNVWGAYEKLISFGFNKHLMVD